MTALQLKNIIRTKLKKGDIQSAEFEAKQIVNKICCNLFCDVTPKQESEAELLCSKRLSGEPLQYLLCEWEFYSLPFKVGHGVLIPRADTEILVEKALGYLKTRESADVVDLCSGSGCIAVSIAKNAPGCRVTAIEKSPDAYEYLKQNISLNHVEVKPVLGDITTDVSGKYDLIVSNPPYIKSNIIPSLQAEVHKEPMMALDGGDDGLFFYRVIEEKWTGHIKPGGKLMVEIGYDQAKQVCSIFESSGLADIQIIKDYSGNDRVIIGTVNF